MIFPCWFLEIPVCTQHIREQHWFHGGVEMLEKYETVLYREQLPIRHEGKYS